ncbi:MAG: hypothetical protein R3F17_16745 [Planctomycetota bacterium]
MKHRDVAVILATGGLDWCAPPIARANPPMESVRATCPHGTAARIRAKWPSIVTSQSFDNGTLCCSEQGLVIDAPVYDKVLSALAERGAHLCSADECVCSRTCATRAGT